MRLLESPFAAATLPRALAVAAVLASVPLVAAAHAFLDHADPAVGKTVAVSPSEVRLWFTQKLEPAFSHVEVSDEREQRVDRDDSQVDKADPRVMHISLKPLPPGAYTVKWRAVSVDTHVTEGSHVFRVAAP